MNEIFKTFIFVAVSAGLAAIAAVSHLRGRVTNETEFALAGKPFYEDFESSAEAKALEVVTVNPDTMELQRFGVQNIEGTWRIPSHHNYPAEAADRLAQAAASAIGITRASVAGKAGDFERLGVVDPLEMDSAKLDDPTPIGQRFTLRDGNGEVLVDLIIGKSAGEVDRAESDPTASAGGKPITYYYVRRPDEKLVYKAVIDLNLSTKFSDWIDPDLLRADSSKIRRINVDNYELKEQPGSFLSQVKALIKEQGDKILLSRKSFSDPWELPDLNLEKEELNSARIQSVLETLGQLTIAGVRPKFKYNNELLLTPDLKFNPALRQEKDVQRAQDAVDEFLNELEDRGFSLAGTQEDLELASASGQLQIGTDEGVLYTLHIGRPIEGTEKEIEIGGAKSVDEVNTEEEKQKIANFQEGEKNRYVMISVAFDDTLLDGKPVKPEAPVEPKKPEGYTPAKPETDKSDQPASADETKAAANEDAAEPKQDKPAEVGTKAEESAKPDESGKSSTKPESEASKQEQQPERDPAFVAYDEAMKAFEQQKIDYELGVTRFEEETKAFDKKIVEGKKLVDELNQRFSDWYYVIRGSNLRTLRLKRADVVQAKADSQETPPPANPAIPNFGQSIPPGAQVPEMKFDPEKTQAPVGGKTERPDTPSESSETKTDSPDTSVPLEKQPEEKATSESKPAEDGKSNSADPSQPAEGPDENQSNGG
jgi:hypothetical protein